MARAYGSVQILDRNGIAITGTASGADYGLDVNIIGGSVVTDLGKAEDSPHVSGDTGAMVLAVRNDTPSALAGNGDYIPLTTDSLGFLYVKTKHIDSSNADLDLTTGGQTGLKAMVVGDGDKFVRGAQANNSSQVGGPVIVGGIGSASPLSPVTDGFASNVWLDLNGRVRLTGDASMTPLLIDGAGTVNPIPISGTVSATITGSVAAAIDELPAAATSSDSMPANISTTDIRVIPMLMNSSTVDRQRAVTSTFNTVATGIAAAGLVGQFDDVSPTSVTENNFGVLRMSTARVLYTNLRTAAGAEILQAPQAPADTFVAGSSTQIINFAELFNGSSWDRIRSAANATNSTGTGITAVALTAQLDNTSPTTITENQFGNLRMSTERALMIGGIARTANPTAYTALDAASAFRDKLGKTVLSDSAPRELAVHQTTAISNSVTETTILTAGAAGVFHDLKTLVITNKTATPVTVTIKDATAGTTRMVFNVVASGQVNVPFSTPAPQAVAANNWTATLSALLVDLDIYILAIKTV